MANASDVLDIALGEVGYYAPDDPEPGSKYGRWLADLTGEGWLAGPSTEIWWCCMFVSWCLAQAGQGCVGFPSYNTDNTLSKNPPLVLREDAEPGDIIIWNWDGNSSTDHIGFVKEHEPGAFGRLITVEGNYRNSVDIVDRSDCWELVSAVIRPPYQNGENMSDINEQVRFIYDHMHWDDETHFSNLGNLVAQMPIPCDGGSASIADVLSYTKSKTDAISTTLKGIEAAIDKISKKLGA